MKVKSKSNVIDEPKLVEPARFMSHLADGPTSAKITASIKKKTHAEAAFELLKKRARDAKSGAFVFVRSDELRSDKKNAMYKVSTAEAGILILDRALYKATDGRFRLRPVKDLRGEIRQSLQNLPPDATFVVSEDLGVKASVFRIGFMPYEPFTYVKDGKNKGTLIDLYNALTGLAGVEFSLNEFGIDKALISLPADQVGDEAAEASSREGHPH